MHPKPFHNEFGSNAVGSKCWLKCTLSFLSRSLLLSLALSLSLSRSLSLSLAASLCLSLLNSLCLFLPLSLSLSASLCLQTWQANAISASWPVNAISASVFRISGQVLSWKMPSIFTYTASKSCK